MEYCCRTEKGLLPPPGLNYTKTKGDNMAKKNKVKMPSSSGGLIRYFDEYEETLQFDPKWIIGGITGLIILEILLHVYGQALLV